MSISRVPGEVAHDSDLYPRRAEADRLRRDRRHVVVVEAYQGQVEFVSDEPYTLAAASGLGLPLTEVAERLDARFTVLAWDAFIELERSWKSFLHGMPAPATKSVEAPSLAVPGPELSSGRIHRISVSATDPEHKLPMMVAELSKLSHTLLHESDPLFFLSYCLDRELRALQERDPFDAVIVPMWGGLGYVPQLTRAIGIDGCVRAPFAVVVTDTSENRQRANQEGLWSRQAITRRQCEAISLALSDVSIAFGERGKHIARSGSLRTSAEPVLAPRHVPDAVLHGIEKASQEPRTTDELVAAFVHEPLQPASGVLVFLDAVKILNQRGERPDVAYSCSGPAMTFAPMAPRQFEEYWRSRPFVRELEDAGYWQFLRARPSMVGSYPVRIFPHLFAHLPNIWTELALGSQVLLSAAACEGLMPAGVVPSECKIGDTTDPRQLAHALSRTQSLPISRLDAARRELCGSVVTAHRGPARAQALDDLAAALQALCSGPPSCRDLGRAARLLLDRTRTLHELDRTDFQQQPSANTLTVVITCCDMGDFLRETVASVWCSDRQPDELLVIDDGSRDSRTLEVLVEMEREASLTGRKLVIVRQDNQGLAAARNRGLEAATSEFVSFLDGDDIIGPSFYQVAMTLMTRYPSLGGVAAWSEIFDEGGPAGYWNAPQAELPYQYTENCIFVPCLVRTSFLREIGGYDVRQRFNYEDWELTCRILASGKPIVTIPAYMQKYRIRQDSMFRTMTPVQNQVMRELFLGNHRETVSKFAPELVMLIENRLMWQLQRNTATRNREGQSTTEAIYPARAVRMGLRKILLRTRQIWPSIRKHLKS